MTNLAENIEAAQSGWMAFCAGLLASPHCLLMCGPLAFIFLGSSAKHLTKREAFWNSCVYNGTRVFSFTLLGTLAGGIGFSVAEFIPFPLLKVAPWVLVVFLFVIGLKLERFSFLKKGNLLPKVIIQKIQKLSIRNKAFLLGISTPLIPCAPFYLVLWAALFSGLPSFGFKISLGYALGTVPLMLLSTTLGQKTHRLGPWIGHVQRVLALCLGIYLALNLIFQGESGKIAWCCP